MNIGRVKAMLSYLTVLKQSVPVIENLIKNSESIDKLEMGLGLIKQANDMIQFKLQGITLTDDYSNSLIKLKSKCILKIEIMCISLVDCLFNK